MYSKNPVVIANDFNQLFHPIGKTTARTATQLAIESDINIPTGMDYPTRPAQHSFLMNCLILPIDIGGIDR